MGWIRLRQIALVAADLDAVVDELHAILGLEVAFHDPSVAAFGLRNAVLPLGNQFVEVVSPVREGTAGGRQLARLGGDGGYMVICHTDDHPAVSGRVDDLGIRRALDVVEHGYHIMQLHPADTGGSFLEIDFQPGGEDPAGPWMPAGPAWQRARRVEVADAITAVVVACRDVGATSATWAAITSCELHDNVLRLDNAHVRFVAGALDALVAIEVRATDRDRVGEHWTVAGVDVTLI